MGRRVASQVHRAAARLAQGGLLKREPVWMSAIASFPPIPLPARASPLRDPAAEDLPRTKSTHQNAHSAKHMRIPKPKMEAIVYLEDKIRRQFFRDHPFEAFRARTLVENQAEVEEEHPTKGTDWKELIQRSRNPSTEDAIQFALNLHKHHKVSLATAYDISVNQYRSLRAIQALSSQFAVMEAQAYGAQLGPTDIEVGFNLEQEKLKSWVSKEETDPNAIAARKRWKAIADKPLLDWTEGQEYVKKWQAKVRPDYTLKATKAEQPVAPVKDTIGILTPSRA